MRKVMCKVTPRKYRGLWGDQIGVMMLSHIYKFFSNASRTDLPNDAALVAARGTSRSSSTAEHATLMRARLQHDRRFSIFACAVFVCATLASIFSPAFAIPLLAMPPPPPLSTSPPTAPPLPVPAVAASTVATSRHHRHRTDAGHSSRAGHA